MLKYLAQDRLNKQTYIQQVKLDNIRISNYRDYKKIYKVKKDFDIKKIKITTKKKEKIIPIVMDNTQDLEILAEKF